ncbi:MAG: ATP-binding protein [Bacteroidales bacterium]|jgi:anti-sigma regulatory factor (Ser/Thr protein kinase)|nr:ATP-binding protein [Bacteroidales bacterium]
MILRFEPITSRCGEIVEKLMSSSDMPTDKDLRFKIRLSIEEVVENIVQYAYDQGHGWLEAETRREGDSVVIILRDAGTPFDPLAKPDPDITLPAEQRQIGGLGIYLCKQLMDSVKYTYENGCNVLTLSKRG